MWGEDLGGVLRGEDQEPLGPEEVPVVRARARRPVFFPVVFDIYPEREEDFARELGDSVARRDDAYWSFVSHRRRFSWPAFYRWWVARRWVMPRDVTKR